MTKTLNLTKSEKKVLEKLNEGLYYKEIASEFDIRIDTVKKHCFNMYKKLGVRNKTQAILIIYGQQTESL